MARDHHLMSRTQTLAFAGAVVASIIVGISIGVAFFGAPGPIEQARPDHPRVTLPPVVVHVSLHEFAIDADTNTLPAGAPVRFVVENNGTIQHDFKVGGVTGLERLDPGSEGSFEVDAEGSAITAWCTVLGHREAGMEVTFAIADGR